MEKRYKVDQNDGTNVWHGVDGEASNSVCHKAWVDEVNYGIQRIPEKVASNLAKVRERSDVEFRTNWPTSNCMDVSDMLVPPKSAVLPMLWGFIKDAPERIWNDNEHMDLWDDVYWPVPW